MQTQLSQLANPEAGGLDDIVDLDHFPLQDPNSGQWTALIDQVRAQLQDDGCATLKNFLTPEALAAVADEIAGIAPHVPIRQQSSTVYARTDLEAGLDSDDPRTKPQVWNAGHVTRDMIPPYSLAHRLYVSPHFKAFIAATVGAERVFEYADPIAGLVATVLPPGGEYPWHYDTNEFVVTIMTQAPEEGGEFVYHQDLRTAGDENFDGLRDVLDGTPETLGRVVAAKPGDLQLFLGRYSLHKVNKVAGDLARHVLVLSYAERPGIIGPADRTRVVYGRVTEAHLLADQARLAENDGLIL